MLKHVHASSFCSLLFIFSGVPALANVVGTDLQNFNPTPGGLDFITVHSSETLDPGIVNLGVYLNYAANSLPDYEDKSSGYKTSFEDTLVSSDINLGYGVLNNWELGISFPQIVRQEVDPSRGSGGELKSTGLTEIRAHTKYRLFGSHDRGLALVGSVNFNQIKNNPYAGQDAGPTTNVEVAFDQTYRKIAYALNVGYRFRQPGRPISGIPVVPLRNQVIASVAVNYLFPSIDTKLIFELLTAFSAEASKSSATQNQSVGEVLIGVKHDINSSLSLHLGGGTEVLPGAASPDLRVYGGFNWAYGPLFGRRELVVTSRPVVQTVDPEMEINLKQLKKSEATREKTRPQADRAWLEQVWPPSTKPEPVSPDEALPEPARPAPATKVDFATLQPKIREEFIVQDILFETNSDRLGPGSAAYLSQLAAHLNKPPRVREMIIEGHSDSVGDRVYNIELSLLRAIRVKKFLVKEFGIDPKVILTVGYGPDRPIANNGNYQGRRINRRVEFKVFRERANQRNPSSFRRGR